MKLKTREKGPGFRVVIGGRVVEIPYYDSWILEERCPVCGGRPEILRYESGEAGCAVSFRCPRCRFQWGALET